MIATHRPMWVPLLLWKYSSAFPWSCFCWEAALHRASLCVPVKSLLFDVGSFLKMCFFQHEPESVTDSSEERVGSRNKYSFRLLSLRAWDHKKKCNLAGRRVSVLCSKVWCGGDQELVISTELIPAFIVAALRTSKKKSYSLYTYKHNFQSWSRVIFTCKFKRRACLIWAGGHAV